MRILLICSVFREGIGKSFGLPEQNLGGWISGIIDGLSDYPDVHFSYAVFQKGKEDSIKCHVIDNINYYLISYSSQKIIKQFFAQTDVDVYHLFGAEHKYIRDLETYLPMNKTLVYIQGLISEYVLHFDSNCGQYYKINNPLFRPYIRLNAALFGKQGETERKMIQNCKYITGRTEWDKAALYKLHCSAQYFHVNESLRSQFYTAEKWKLSGINRHTIFVSQTNYPIKAAHMIAEIIKILVTYYPDIRCEIAGYNLMESHTIATRLGFSYASLIQKIVRNYHLENNMVYIGAKSADQMIEHLQKSHVFLLASSIENSPNSLQEAMKLGVPCVSSYVGGVGSLVTANDQCVLYPFDDPMQAAFQISKIFESDDYANSLSNHAIQRIDELTDRSKNASDMYKAYKKIYEDNLNRDCDHE